MEEAEGEKPERAAVRAHYGNYSCQFWIDLATLLVLTLTLAAVVWYACAAQRQVSIGQDELKISQQQLDDLLAKDAPRLVLNGTGFAGILQLPTTSGSGRVSVKLNWINVGERDADNAVQKLMAYVGRDPARINDGRGKTLRCDRVRQRGRQTYQCRPNWQVAGMD